MQDILNEINKDNNQNALIVLMAHYNEKLALILNETDRLEEELNNIKNVLNSLKISLNYFIKLKENNNE